jgi:ABC-type transport system involved in multi-copper enzyme maturation permease subunit
MRSFVALLRLEVRDSSFSLAAAAAVSAALLGAIHAWFPMRAEPALAGVAILMTAWAAYFAADSFATDCASGRMGTRACLPVAATTLWAAKIAFLAGALVVLAAWTVGAELALQVTLGSPASREQFADKLPDMLAGLPLLGVVVSVGVLCSMLVEGALVATLLTAVVIAAIAGLTIPIGRILVLSGVDWRLDAWLRLATVLACLLLGCSAAAFVAGQRRMGSRIVRVKVALALTLAMVAVGGIAGGSAIYRRFSAGLDDPRMRFVGATASADGRWIALEGHRDLRGNDDPPMGVWVVDVDSGKRTPIAKVGQRMVDRFAFTSLVWDDAHPLRVVRCKLLDPRRMAEILDVHAGGAEPRLESLGEGMSLRTRVVGDWADISVTVHSNGKRSTMVRWKDRGLELCFRGAGIESAPGRGVLPGPVPGRVLAVEGGRVVLHDMQNGSTRTLFEGEVRSMIPSPDGSAVLVWADQASAALSSTDGSLLHEPWTERQSVHWVDSSVPARVVEVSPVGVILSKTLVLDLDTDREFEIERDHGHPLLHRLGNRGYVFVDRGGDVVWVDLEGKLVKVLVDR